MPLNRRNQRSFHKTLYAGELETCTLLKRNDDQQQGTVTTYTLFNTRRSRIYKTGEPIQYDISSDERAIWHIPRQELDRVGVDHLNAADRIVDKFNRYWQPESNTNIVIQLFENMVNLDCVRIDPPSNPVTPLRLVP